MVRVKKGRYSPEDVFSALLVIAGKRVDKKDFQARNSGVTLV